MPDAQDGVEIQSQTGQMNTKPYLKSKTLWFNMAVAMFAVLSSYTHLLQSYLPEGGYLFLMMSIAAINVYLRTITTQPVIRK